MSLRDWLSYQEGLHPRKIDLGLERLTQVLKRLQWRPPTCPVIIVGGTNGKGSCVAMLESILTAGGYRVGTFTSPHLIRYNERIRIAGQEVSDASLVTAFERIEAARGDTSITFFEFNTLAALLIFETAGLDAVVLEVGMGGRLDAVNVVDPDVAIVCSVALDHCEWLGSDVESIGREKAGIFRATGTAIFGSRAMPSSIVTEAKRVGAKLLVLGRDFEPTLDGENWQWKQGDVVLKDLPRPGLVGAVQLDNAATVLSALKCLAERLPLTHAEIESGLRGCRLPGRFHSVRKSGGGAVEWLLDVAHNPAAAATLSTNLADAPTRGRTLAVCGMFGDKDVAGVIAAVRTQIDLWIAAGVDGTRALPPSQLSDRIREAGGAVAYVANSVADACAHAASLAVEGDRIVVFGSFHTVGPAMEWLGEES